MGQQHARSFTWVFIGLIAPAVFVACQNVAPPPVMTVGLPEGAQSDTAWFRQQVDAHRNGVTHTRKRKAVCTLCANIDVSIQAMGITSEVNPLNFQGSPRGVAYLKNLSSDKTEAYYTLEAGQEGILWVTREPSGRARWTILRKSRTANAVIAGRTTDLNYCHLYIGQPAGATDADFADDHEKENGEGKCDVPIPSIYHPMNTASMLQFPGVAMVIDYGMSLLGAARSDGGWIECANGCCT